MAEGGCSWALRHAFAVGKQGSLSLPTIRESMAPGDETGQEQLQMHPEEQCVDDRGEAEGVVGSAECASKQHGPRRTQRRGPCYFRRLVISPPAVSAGCCETPPARDRPGAS